MGILSYVGSFFDTAPPNQMFSDRYVLVTGCDSIVGNWVARALHKRGYYVFAGCLTETAFKEFLAHNSAPNFRPFLFDITKDTSIQQCARMVAHETKDKGLFALVNSAGCNEGFAFEFTSNDQILKTMDVNFMGPTKIIKALLPSLKQNIRYNLKKAQKHQDISPRIVMMTSVLGRTTIPFYGAYSASKHALEAMLDTVRVELLPWKIHISMIESVPLTSRLTHPDLLEISKKFFASPEITQQTLTLYGEDYIQKAIEFWQKLHSSHDDPNKEIVRTVVEAIEIGFPKDRYVIGTIAKVQVFVHNVLPRWVLDLAWGSLIRLVGVWPKEVRELEDVHNDSSQLWTDKVLSEIPLFLAKYRNQSIFKDFDELNIKAKYDDDGVDVITFEKRIQDKHIIDGIYLSKYQGDKPKPSSDAMIIESYRIRSSFGMSFWSINLYDMLPVAYIMLLKKTFNNIGCYVMKVEMCDESDEITSLKSIQAKFPRCILNNVK
ncbi:12260_t:CDS:2, partial [Entrophospora sp. SA101]